MDKAVIVGDLAWLFKGLATGAVTSPINSLFYLASLKQGPPGLLDKFLVGRVGRPNKIIEAQVKLLFEGKVFARDLVGELLSGQAGGCRRAGDFGAVFVRAS